MSVSRDPYADLTESYDEDTDNRSPWEVMMDRLVENSKEDNEIGG
jgi:hypothetical protein